MLQTSLVVLTSVILLLTKGLAYAQNLEKFGLFEGKLILEPMDDGRKMKVNQEFVYVDPNKVRWVVPAEAVVDGASIPQPLWSLVGSPYTGNYRKAAVVHDRFCEEKSRPWQKVHRMFYDASLAGGTDLKTAKIMYAAVYVFGPKWKAQAGADGRQQTESWKPEVTEEKFKQLVDWVQEQNPTLEEIEALVK